MSAPESPDTARPPSVLRVAQLIISIEARRWLNRSPWARISKGKPRSGTARKRAPAQLLLAIVSLILALNVVNNTTRIVHQIAALAEQHAYPGMASVSQETLDWLDEVLRHDRPVGTVWRSESEQLKEVFDFAAREELAIERDQRAERTRELQAIYARRGRAGFRVTQIRDVPWPSTTLWYHGGDPREMLAPLGAIAFLLGLAVTLLSVVGTDRDLARSESTLEWWFTFPVPTRGLLLARLLGAALVNPLLWLLPMPFLWVVLWCAGCGPWLGALLAVLATLYYGVLAGSMRVAVETTLRARLPLRRVAQLQAFLELFASVPMLLAIAASSSAGLSFIIEHTRALPAWVLHNPFSLPVAWLLPEPQASTAVLATIALAGLSMYAALAIGSHMLRDGLLSSTGPLLGSRKASRNQAAASDTDRSLFGTLARHELTAIVREPARLARVLILPFAIIWLPLLMDPSLLRSIVGSPAHASAAAFGVGSFVLMGGGLLSLANEGPGLWLLYTAPCSLDGVLLRRGLFWALVAALFAALTFAAIALTAHANSLSWAAHGLLALLGVGLYGTIAVALGALGTDVLESERGKRMRPFTPQLFMLLSGMFSFALYTPSLWAKFAQLALSSLLAFALWQKVHDHTPYLLDPTEAPPPRIAVADGIFAALSFFVLQGLFGFLFARLHMSPGLAMLFAFVGAGLIVTGVSLYAFWSMRVPALWSALGFSAPDAQPLRAALWGVLAGALGGAVGVVYTLAIERIHWLHRIYEETERLDPTPEQLPWLCGLAVFAAPLFEELIFRGILFRGFRRSLGALPAALASALVFALVHPPLAFVPVFVMAFLAASVFERSRLLLAPIMAHMTYNAMIVGLTLLARP